LVHAAHEDFIVTCCLTQQELPSAASAAQQSCRQANPTLVLHSACIYGYHEQPSMIGSSMNRYLALLPLVFACAAHAAAPEAVPAAKESKTASGIGITILKEGTGASPKASDTVKVHYRGTLADGKEFDSSYKRGEPTSFPLKHVIPCWTEGIQQLKVGGKARLNCPPNLAYGSRGAGGVIPPNATLNFEVELLAIEK
jgi:FKBP-type peptidyl-prolyl cis-trans isomerase FkpA